MTLAGAPEFAATFRPRVVSSTIALAWVATGQRAGYVTGIFLFGYGLARASLETVRQPDFGMENLPLGLTMGMMLSIPMMLIGAWLIWRAWSRPPVAAEG